MRTQMMRNNKAQVTQFIIIGILILILVSLFLYLRPKVAQEQLATAEQRLLGVPLEARPVYAFIDKCVNDVSVPGIYTLGLQGGHIFAPGETIKSGYGNVSYGFKDGRSVLPTRQMMETEISAYVGQALVGCLGGFETFKAQGKTIETGAASVQSEILPDKVIVHVKYPVTLVDEKGRTAIDENHDVDVKIPLGKAEDAAAMAIEGLAENPEWMDMTGLSSVDAKSNIIALDAHTLLYAISFATQLPEGPFVFMFAAAIPPQDYPRLKVEPAYELTEDKQFTLQLQAAGNGNITFEAYTALFDMAEDGSIQFIPEIPGNYTFQVRAVDEKGHYDSRNITFAVRRRA